MKVHWKSVLVEYFGTILIDHKRFSKSSFELLRLEIEKKRKEKSNDFNFETVYLLGKLLQTIITSTKTDHQNGVWKTNTKRSEYCNLMCEFQRNFV